jgi:hypothetical protein
MITKNQLLLHIAKAAINWGEGADFEMTELIHESLNNEQFNAVKHHYPEYFVKSLNEEDYPDTEEGFKAYEEAEKWYEKEGKKLYGIIKKDVNNLLTDLISKI